MCKTYTTRSHARRETASEGPSVRGAWSAGGGGGGLGGCDWPARATSTRYPVGFHGAAATSAVVTGIGGAVGLRCRQGGECGANDDAVHGLPPSRRSVAVQRPYSAWPERAPVTLARTHIHTLYTTYTNTHTHAYEYDTSRLIHSHTRQPLARA